MASRRQGVVWVLAAFTALAAQAAPQTLCRACDQPCCASRGSDQCPAVADTARRPAGECPLCAVAVGTSPCAADQPCRCQLDGGQERPISAPPGTSLRFDRADQGVVAVADRPNVPVVSGVSREAVAALRAAPIRPVRILYGVWLN